MKRLLNPAIFLLLIYVMPICISEVRAQTLEDLMTMAVNNRELVKQYLADVEKSRENIRLAKGYFYPSVDVSYSGNHYDGDSSTAQYYEKSHRLTAGMTLNVFSGFKDYYNLKAENQRHLAEQYRLSAIEQDIKLDVGLAFLQVHRNMAFLNVADNAYRLLEKEHQNALLKYKVGILKKNDALKIKVQMDDAAQEVNRAKTAVEKSINDLKRIVAANINPAALDWCCFDELPHFMAKENYEPILLSQRSELNALRAFQAAARLGVKSARSALYPQMDLSTHYYNAKDEYTPGGGDDIDHEFGLQLLVSLNVFDGFRKYADIGKARLDALNAGYDVAELERQLKTRLNNILLDLDVALQNLDVALASESEANENLRITELQFQKGVTTSTEILDAISFLARAQFNVIDARTLIFENHFYLTRMIEAFPHEIVTR